MVNPTRADGEPHAVVRHMGLTHAEFLRSLPAVAGDMDLHVEGSYVRVEDATRRVEIRLGPERQRHLGSLVLPLTEINLILHGFSPAERMHFLRRFERAFQRGGG